MVDILSFYKKYNRPGGKKPFLIEKSEGIQITLNDVQTFISSKAEA
jgi:hypothetical protein